MRCLLLVPLLLFSAAIAAAEDFRIDSYRVDIRVTNDAVLDVTETIDVGFRIPRHGIFRDIPFRYSVPNAMNPYSTLLYDISVDGDPFEVSTERNYIHIKIGSAYSTVSGTHRYTLRYKVYGAIMFYDKFPELYWNLTGDKWNVPIEEVLFTIRFPKNYSLSPDDYYAVAGSYGSQGGPVRYRWDGSALSGETTRELNPREGVTAAVRLPPGELSDGSLRLRTRLFLANYGALGIPALVFLVMFGAWFLFGKDEELPEMVFFKPPEDFTAAEAGVIIDDKADNRDLTGQIVEWAAKGYLSIREMDLGGSPEYILKKLRDLPKTARSYEHTIFSGLFDGRDSVSVDGLKEVFYPVMKQAREELNIVIDSMKLYEPGTRGARSVLKLLAIAVLFLSFWIAGMQFNFLYLCAGLLSSFIILIFAAIIPKKTPEGQRRFQHIKGFRQFMRRVQEPQLKLLLKSDPHYFDKTIPYAMVFGMAAVWCSRFEGLLAAPPEWFSSGPSGFHSFNSFGSSLDHSFSSMNSAFTSVPAPQGGSGFSGGGFSGGGGGGFSGGGFGGGGGGSW